MRALDVDSFLWCIVGNWSFSSDPCGTLYLESWELAWQQPHFMTPHMYHLCPLIIILVFYFHSASPYLMAGTTSVWVDDKSIMKTYLFLMVLFHVTLWFLFPAEANQIKEKFSISIHMLQAIVWKWQACSYALNRRYAKLHHDVLILTVFYLSPNMDTRDQYDSTKWVHVEREI